MKIVTTPAITSRPRQMNAIRNKFARYLRDINIVTKYQSWRNVETAEGLKLALFFIPDRIRLILSVMINKSIISVKIIFSVEYGKRDTYVSFFSVLSHR